ncbi:MAG: hypothetical protein ABIQ52_12310 [Vicinamibacterales bacterium]
MSAPTPIVTAPPPRLSVLARTTAVSLGAAAVILTTLVLPAEYGIDPLGTGRRLGLTDIAAPPRAAVEDKAPLGSALAPVRQGPLGIYPVEFKADAVEFTLEPYDRLEYKYRLEKDATMVYSWTASAPLLHDMHGERAGGAARGEPTEDSYDKQDRREGHGTLTAPFTGIHGWFWENPGGEPVTIRLSSAGFYTAAIEIRADRRRYPHALRSAATLADLIVSEVKLVPPPAKKTK